MLCRLSVFWERCVKCVFPVLTIMPMCKMHMYYNLIDLFEKRILSFSLKMGLFSFLWNYHVNLMWYFCVLDPFYKRRFFADNVFGCYFMYMTEHCDVVSKLRHYYNCASTFGKIYLLKFDSRARTGEASQSDLDVVVVHSVWSVRIQKIPVPNPFS